jgi:hydrogenase/urease accessory protein HupE
MGMPPVPLNTLGVGVARHHVQEPVLGKAQGAVVGPAEPLTGLDHLVENGLDSRAAGRRRGGHR